MKAKIVAALAAQDGTNSVNTREVDMSGKDIEIKKLLSVKDFCAYMGIGETVARELLKAPNCPYSFRLNGRVFANKTKLDKWIDQNTGI